jgi:DNA-binding NarL/FixJ family response regulator
MANILSVSVEPALLYTRGLVLERTGAFVESVTPDKALPLIRTCCFDVVVICHSLPQEDAEQVCNQARECHPTSKILLMESPYISHPPAVQFDYRVSLDDGPSFLVSAARNLLAGAGSEALNAVEPTREEIATLSQPRASKARPRFSLIIADQSSPQHASQKYRH